MDATSDERQTTTGGRPGERVRESMNDKYDPLKRGEKPDSERRDPYFAYPDEVTDEQEQTLRDLIARATAGTLALVGSPNVTGKVMLLMVAGEVAIYQTLDQYEALTIARQLLEFVGIESMIATKG